MNGSLNVQWTVNVNEVVSYKKLQILWLFEFYLYKMTKQKLLQLFG